MTKHKPAKHYTSTVYVISSTIPAKVLLLHHKKFDNWMPPGGHQEEWENPIETAIREVHEETGIDVSAYMPVLSPIDAKRSFIPRANYLVEVEVPAHGKEPLHYHLDHSYVVRIPEQPTVHNKHESHAIRWYTIDELDALPMFHNVRTIAKQEMTQI